MNPQGNDHRPDGRASRRTLLKASTGLLALGAAGTGEGALASREQTAVKNGRIKQSIVHWCFEKYWDVPRMIEVAKQLGCVSIELIEPKYFPLLKQAGLECAIGTID